MRRIMIVGSPGAGKTTLAVSLGQTLGLPVGHLDRLFWRKGHAPLTAVERKAAVATVLASPGYVLEGGYPQSYAARLADCDTLVWIDLALGLRLKRVLLRAARSFGRRTATDCPTATGPKAAQFWRGFWLGHAAQTDELEALVAKATPSVVVVRLRSPAEVQAFLDSLE